MVLAPAPVDRMDVVSRQISMDHGDKKGVFHVRTIPRRSQNRGL